MAALLTRMSTRPNVSAATVQIAGGVALHVAHRNAGSVSELGRETRRRLAALQGVDDHRCAGFVEAPGDSAPDVAARAGDDRNQA